MNYYFITGSSRGIGKALSQILLQEENTTVFGYGRTCSIEHENYKHEKVDFSNIDTLTNWTFPDLKNAEKIVLINNAGVINEIHRLGKLHNINIIKDIQVNLTTVGVLMNRFISKYSSLEIPRLILNISSGAGRHPIDAWSGYCASKAGVDMLSKVAATEQNKLSTNTGLRIFSVAPGVVDTSMQDQIRASSKDDFSGVQRFIDLKNNGDLYPPEKSAKLLLKFIRKPENYSEIIYDIRENI